MKLDYLKANCKKIHFFGLGFIQLKLNDHQRLHFYTTKFHPIVEDSSIHNHRYDFSSLVLKGCLANDVFKVRTKGVKDSHLDMRYVSCDPDKEPPSERWKADILDIDHYYYSEGEQYFFKINQFHKVWVDRDTITLITRSRKYSEFALVVQNEGTKEVCPFSLKVPESECWDIVEDMIKGVPFFD